MARFQIRMLARTALVLGGLILAGGLSGCLVVAGAAGVGGAYALGEETMHSERDAESTIMAVRQAFDDYGVTYTDTERQPGGAYVRGHKFMGDDTENVAVGVWDKGAGQPVKIEVRIGTIGKKTESLELMGLIRKRLDALAPSASPR